MFTPAELTEALRRRVRRSIRPLPEASGLPPSWQAWFDLTAEHAGPASNARAGSLVDSLARRDPVPPPAVELISGWKALRALWRQQWEPPGRDERGLRVASRTISVMLHLLLLAAMSALMHARFMLAEADAQRGEHVIEVEYIGSGTPEEEGGGAPPEPAVAQVQTQPQDLPVSEPEPAAVPAPPPPQPEPQPELAAEPSPDPAVETPQSPDQSVIVTETPLPDGPFQLPPLRPLEVTRAQAPVPEVEVTPRMREIGLAETIELSAPQAQLADRATPELAAPEVEIVEREIALPPQTLDMPQVPVPAIEAPERTTPEQQARVRDIPMPPASESVEPARETQGQEAIAQPDTAPAPVADRTPELQDPGMGPAQVQREGRWSTPRRDDDWGAAARDRPGGQGGTASLFNPDGSPRLPPGSGRVGGGLPPGTITEDYENIDRMGTWLRRPPTDYEPTSLDRFWVPHENLLEEWVRRSVRTVLIPIPGTSKSIRCNVATLAFAGGCDIVDPNLQDDPASARPPPDVPFRPELHENQEGLSDDVWDQPSP